MTPLPAMTGTAQSAAAAHLPATCHSLDLAALVGAEGWARLPAAVRRRFGLGHADATYAGRVTMHCAPAGRVFAFAARLFGRPLSAACARAVPAVVRVSDDGEGGMTWARSFHTPGDGARAPHVVRSTKQLGPDGRLFERTAGGLGMALDVFEEAGSLVFRSRRFWLVAGRLRVPVPTWLSPGTCRVVHTDLGGGLFEFSLDMRHPRWGHTFHQSGVFADPAVDAVGAEGAR